MRIIRLSLTLGLFLGLLLIIFAVTDMRYIVIGGIRGEHVFHGRPVSFWRIAVRKWLDEDPEIRDASQTWFERTIVRARRSRMPIVLEPDPSAVPVLLELVKDSNKDVRRCAFEAVLHSGPSTEDLLPLLLTSLKDDDRKSRWLAAFALKNLHSSVELALPALIEASKDPEGIVRVQAADSLWKLCGNPDICIPVLVESLTDTSRNVRCAALRALANIGVDAKAAVPAILQVCACDDSYTRRCAREALAKIAPDVSVPRQPEDP